MRILIVAATADELTPLITEFKLPVEELRQNGNCKIFGGGEGSEHAGSDLLITGVGMVATAFAVGIWLSNHSYELVINLGIAGSFDRSIPLGQLVEISQDTLSEPGAEDDEDFLTIGQLGFGEDTFHPSKKLSDLYNLFNNFNLQAATAITVNTVHGNERSIAKVTRRLQPQIESMEGAAFFYACKKFNAPCLQIRAVSNYVEKRNRDSWKIGLAIKNLNNFALEFLKLYA
jgi:futalosine hydrolase